MNSPVWNLMLKSILCSVTKSSASKAGPQKAGSSVAVAKDLLMSGEAFPNTYAMIGVMMWSAMVTPPSESSTHPVRSGSACFSKAAHCLNLTSGICGEAEGGGRTRAAENERGGKASPEGER